MEHKLLKRIRVVLSEKDMTNKQLAELVGNDPAEVLEVSADELLRIE